MLDLGKLCDIQKGRELTVIELRTSKRTSSAILVRHWRPISLGRVLGGQRIGEEGFELWACSQPRNRAVWGVKAGYEHTLTSRKPLLR